MTVTRRTLTEEDIQNDVFSTPLDNTTAAEIHVGVPIESAYIGALVADSPNLFEADVDYLGDMTFDVKEDGTHKKVTLNEELRHVRLRTRRELEWGIGIHPTIPVALTTHLSSGAIQADLRRLKLTGFNARVSSGALNAWLPESDIPINASFHLSSGHMSIHTSENTPLNLQGIHLSSGNFDFYVAEGASFHTALHVSSGKFNVMRAAGVALRVHVERISSGKVRLPESFQRIAGEKRKHGIWQSPGFDDADKQCSLTIKLSSGKITIYDPE